MDRQMERPPVSEEVAIKVGTTIEDLLSQFGDLDPINQEAAIISCILALSEKLFRTVARDPHFTFLLLMVNLKDIYSSMHGETK